MTLNNVCALRDARAAVTHKKTGRADDYLLTASCKAEQVGGTRRLASAQRRQVHVGRAR